MNDEKEGEIKKTEDKNEAEHKEPDVVANKLDDNNKPDEVEQPAAKKHITK